MNRGTRKLTALLKSMGRRREECIIRMKRCLTDDDRDGAVIHAYTLLHELHTAQFHHISSALSQYHIDTIGIGQPADEHTAESWALLGVLYFDGCTVNLGYDIDKAFKCFAKAAALGHIYALHMYGDLLLHSSLNPSCWTADVDQTIMLNADAVFLKCQTRAAESGCAEACWALSRYYEFTTHPGPHLSAVWELRALLAYNDLTSDFKCTRDVCSWDRWTGEKEYQVLVPDHVHQAMVSWMFVTKRMVISRDVAILVASWICTRPDKTNL